MNNNSDKNLAIIEFTELFVLVTSPRENDSRFF
jgi:hypothetical protein